MQTHNRLSHFLVPLLVQTGLVYSLNCVNAIQWCALIFSLFTLHILYIANKTSIKNALYIHTFAILINLLMNMNKIFYIFGKPISGLFIVSYLSVFSSIALGLFFFTKTKNESVLVRFFIASMFVSLIDALGMMLFFIHVYSLDRVLQIFMKEVGFKAFYVGLILATIYGVRAGMERMQRVNKD